MADESVKITTIGAKATRRDEYSDAGLVEGKKWAAIKTAFRFGTEKTALGKTVITSLLCVLLCVPGIVWVILFATFFGNKVGSYTPFGAFDGLGYPSGDVLDKGLNTALINGNMWYYQNALIQFSVLIPCIICAALGVGGLVYVARMSMNGEKVKIFRDFFRGVKYTWSSSLIAGALVGANIFLVVFCAYVFDAYFLGVGGKIVTIIFSSLLLIFVIIYSFYLITLAANYKLPILYRLKDALMLSVKGIINNLLAMVFVGIIIGAAIIFMLLLGATSTFGTLIWFLLFFFGFYAIAAIFMAFSLPMFNKYINAGMRERESHAATEQAYAAIRAQKAADKAAGKTSESKKKNAPQKFVNPKKKKKTDTAETEKAASEPKQTNKPAEVKPVKKKGYTDKELEQLEEDRKKLLEEKVQEPAENLEDLSVYADDEDV